jgi:hypothetical protein
MDDPAREFDRQVAALVAAGHAPRRSRRLRALEALRDEVLGRSAAVAPRPGGLPFALVLPGVPAAESMPRIVLAGRAGFVSADGADLDRFGEIDAVALPAGEAYALLDVHRGDEYANRSPDEAVPEILAAGRTPLTVAEGIAVLTVAPRLLEKNHCFMVPASRDTDRRVPALWISGGTGKDGPERRGAAKLGWCWAGNRHTWLGHASAAARIGPGAGGLR